MKKTGKAVKGMGTIYRREKNILKRMGKWPKATGGEKIK